MGKKAKKIVGPVLDVVSEDTPAPIVVPYEAGPMFYNEGGVDMFCVLGPDARGPAVVTEAHRAKYPNLWARYKGK